jgi:hypothetical protein
MVRARAVYDTDGSWKYRQFDSNEWEALKTRVQAMLRPLFPGGDAKEDPTFGHPADEWANELLSDAEDAVSKTLWLRRRRTNAELRAEHDDLLKALDKAANRLGMVSLDLEKLFCNDVDLLGTRDKINELIHQIQGSTAKIAKLRRATNLKDAQSAAAVEMAIRCLRILKRHGGKAAATADATFGYASGAVKMLKIIGDEIGLRLAEATWKRVIAQAKKAAEDLR